MFGKQKFPALVALIGVAFANISAEQATAVNAELHAEGVDQDIVIASASQIQVATDQITALTAKNEELSKELETEKKKPGAAFAQPPSNEPGDIKPDDTQASFESMIANLPHNRQADTQLL